MIWLTLLLVLPFGLAAIVGAPYLPARKQDIEQILSLADLKPGDSILDLGSGDGKLLRAAAKRGYQAIGYEINPFLFIISLILCWSYRSKIKIRLVNFWQTPLPQVSAVYVFLIPRLMNKLHLKMQHEAAPQTVLVSYAFAIPKVKPAKVSNNAFAYRYPI